MIRSGRSSMTIVSPRSSITEIGKLSVANELVDNTATRISRQVNTSVLRIRSGLSLLWDTTSHALMGRSYRGLIEKAIEPRLLKKS